MNMLKLAFTSLAATLCAATGAVMNITVDASGNYLQNGVSDPDLSLASTAFYQDALGITSGTPNSKADNLTFLQTVIANWNANPGLGSSLPDATSAAPVPADNGSLGDINSFTAPAGYEYVVFHFGAGPAGGGSDKDETGWWSAWYLGGESATFSLPVEGDPAKNLGGFSSASFFNGTTEKVPDGGTSLLLFGLGLLGLGGAKRWLGTKA